MGASNFVVVVVVVFRRGRESEEEEGDDDVDDDLDDDEDDDDNGKGTVRSCAEMAFAIFSKTGEGSARMELFSLLPFNIPMPAEGYWKEKKFFK